LVGPARSADATARILHMSASREGRLERRALRLLSASAAGGCAAEAAAIAGAGTSPASRLAAGTGTPPSPSGPSASLSAAHAERSPRGGRQVAPGAVSPPGAVQRAGTGSSPAGAVLVPAVLALLLGLALILTPELRRRLLPAGAPPEAAIGSRRTPSRDAATGPRGTAPRDAATGARRMPPPTRSWTEMDAGLALMAADVFAEMAGETDETLPHPNPEAHGSDTQGQVEGEADEPASEPPSDPR
ncbi:MAG: hypothetical protein ACXVSE_14230, partial [Solirubrobacteraceae bacterium]